MSTLAWLCMVQRCPRQQVLASAQRGPAPEAQWPSCSGWGLSPLWRIAVTPLYLPPPELASEVLAVTTSHSPARALPGSSLLLGTVLPRPDPGRISCHSCLTREAIPSSPSTLELPVPPGAPLLGPPGQLSLGEGVATGPKAHRPGMLDLAQNSAGQSSWYQLGMAFLTL